MNWNRKTHSPPRDGDEFSTFADAVIERLQPDANSEMDETFIRVQRALGPACLVQSAMPEADRGSLKEQLMSSTPYPITGRSQSAPMPATNHIRPTRTVSTLWERVQAAVSIAAVVALVIAMSALVYVQGFQDEQPDPAGTMNAGQAMYDGDDKPSYPVLPADCVSNGPAPADEAFLDRSINDWPAPQYGPVQAVTPEIGEQVRQTYLNFLRCRTDLFPASSAAPPPDEGTPVMYRSLQTDSYLSDRARFVALGDGVFSPPQLESGRQADLNAYLCAPGSATVLAEFPIPVNKPRAYVATTLFPDGTPDQLAVAFSATDVYRLPDGRYGAIIGSISMDALNDPSLMGTSDLMSFIAFIEEDGRYLIDEEFLVEIPGMPADDLFDPCELSRPD